MILCEEKINFLMFDGTTYTDVSLDMADLTSAVGSLDFTAGGYLYFYNSKPLDKLYFSLSSALGLSASLTLEYNDGTNWQIISVKDCTENLDNSGFLNWTVPSDISGVDVNGATECWMRLDLHDLVTGINGVSLLFSDDSDLKIEYPSLLQICYYPLGQSSHINAHISAKNYILTKLKVEGQSKMINDALQNLTMFDLLNISDFKMTSVYYAISHILFELSDNSDDHFWQKYLVYKDKANESFAAGVLQIDRNEDGVISADEVLPRATKRWIR